MYKLKYYSLSKEEKKDLKQKFYQTDFGKNIKIYLQRLLLIGILGVLYSIFIYITNKNIWEIIIASVLLIASIFFIIKSFLVRIQQLNNYLVKKK